MRTVTGSGAAVAVQIARERGDDDGGPATTHLQETFQVGNRGGECITVVSYQVFNKEIVHTFGTLS